MSSEMNVGNLVAGLTMDTSGFTKGLANATGGLAGFQKSINAAKASLVAFMTNPIAIAAGAVGSLAAVGKAAFDMSEEINTAYDAIRIGTGATGAELEGYFESFDNVLKQVPANVQDVGVAISELATRTGFAGEELDSLAVTLLELSRVTETDINSLVADTTRLFGDWGVATEEYENTLNWLLKTSQATGVEISDLSTTVVQYGASLRNMGFTLEEASAMLGKFEKEGVNTETVLSSMRIALAKFAEEGVDAKTAFSSVLDEIKSLDETAGTARAIEVFGSRAGSDMAAAIREGRFEFDELMKAIEESPETIESANKATIGFAERFEMLGKKVMHAMTPLGSGIEVELDKAFKLLNEFADSVLPHIVSFFNYVQSLVLKIREPFEKVFARIGQSFSKFWGESEGTTGDALTVIADTVTRVVDGLATAIEWYLDTIYPAIELFLRAVVAIIKTVSALITGDWDYLWNGLLNITSTILQGITDVVFMGLNAVLDFVEGAVNGIIDSINSIISGINSLTGADFGLFSRVDLNLDTPDVSYLLGLDSGANGVSVVQNITINGDVPNPAQTFSQAEKQAHMLGRGVYL